MADHTLLPGLPPYGELPRYFPAEWRRLGREGVVVRFRRAVGTDWVGNFEPGMGGITAVNVHPDGHRVLVFARGDLWGVDPDAQTAERIAGPIDAAWPVGEPAGLVLSFCGLALARLSAHGILWHTRRLSWDGFEQVRIDGGHVSGLAWNAVTDDWDYFEVDLRTGASTGGSFGPDDTEGWERLATGDDTRDR
jgi:hypothetical protein